MSAQIEVMQDCASNYGVFHVLNSKGDGHYVVSFDGSEGLGHCTCMAFRYGKGKPCKHIDYVWSHACLYNPQWKEGTENPELRPISYTYNSFSSEPCPVCGGRAVHVRRAV